MNLDKYPVISTGDRKVYEFLSEGPNGIIKKFVHFEEIYPNFFNLAFGDWDEENQKTNDKARSKNNDRDKVLATVAAAVIIFIKYYPNATIVAKGSTPARTRLYQMGLFANYHEISQLLTVEGFIDGKWNPIEKHRNYEAFLVRGK